MPDFLGMAWCIPIRGFVPYTYSKETLCHILLVRGGHSQSVNSPVSFSPKRVRNMVKLRGPGASDIMPSTTESLGS